MSSLDPTRSPSVVTAEGGRAIALAGDIYVILVSGDDSGGAYCLMEAIVPPGGGPPPHIQTREDEGFHVLEGSFTFRLGEQVVQLRPGQTANVPRGLLHTFRGDEPGPNRMLVLNAPAGIDRFFEQVGTPSDRHARAPSLSADEIARMVVLAAEYGIEIPRPAP